MAFLACLEFDTDFGGHDLFWSVTPVADAWSCQSACRGMEALGCTHFSYNRYGECNLKTSDEGRAGSEGTVSGPARCLGE